MYERNSEKAARDLAYLADEAIAHLEMCLRTKMMPHAGSVAEYRSRLKRLGGK